MGRKLYHGPEKRTARCYGLPPPHCNRSRNYTYCLIQHSETVLERRIKNLELYWTIFTNNPKKQKQKQCVKIILTSYILVSFPYTTFIMNKCFITCLLLFHDDVVLLCRWMD